MFSARKMEPITSWPWIENNFDLAIYEPNTGIEYAYQVDYNSRTVETPPEDVENLYLLMVNGGMYPNADIQVDNGHLLLKADILSDCFGVKIYESKAGKLTISLDGISVEMAQGDTSAKINGKTTQMPICYQMINGKVYPPSVCVRSLGLRCGVSSGWFDVC